MRENLPYKLPTICRCKSGEWYIQYFYEYPDQPGKYKAFKVKDGINRIHDLLNVTGITHCNFTPVFGLIRGALFQVYGQRMEFMVSPMLKINYRNNQWPVSFKNMAI